MNVIISYPATFEKTLISNLSDAKDDFLDFYIPIKRVPRKLSKFDSVYVSTKYKTNKIIARICFDHNETIIDDGYIHPVTGKTLPRGNYLVCKGDSVDFIYERQFYDIRKITSWRYTEGIFL